MRLHQIGSGEFLREDGNDLKLNFGSYCPTLQIYYGSLNFVLIIGILRIYIIPNKCKAGDSGEEGRERQGDTETVNIRRSDGDHSRCNLSFSALLKVMLIGSLG